MPASRSYDAIVLASHDVGEADRFLILFTRERGRLAARASGVRRPRSHMTGILPLERLTLDIREHRGSFLVTGAHKHRHNVQSEHMEDFLTGMQASELLLALLGDEEPSPQIFDATASFLSLKRRQPHHLLAYSFRIFSLLGVLPLGTEGRLLGKLTEEEKLFIEGSARGEWQERHPPLHTLTAICTKLTEEHATRPLRSGQVAAACA